VTWILNLETATDVCSVALALDGETKSLFETSEGRAHATQLTSLISKCLESCRVSISELDAIAVSIGPGSYTGLRIGLATAKGLCYALEKPLIAAGTLDAMAAGWFDAHNRDHQTLICPMLDARRMEVYAAVYGSDGRIHLPPSAVVIEEGSFSKILDHHKVAFCGSGMPKSRLFLEKQPNAWFDQNFQPSASGMSRLTFEKFKSGEFEDLESAGPVYLKEFFSPSPRKTGI
jgi:tRNA threonylcarbamoyladenosine biosynthesis protein TsaB